MWSGVGVLQLTAGHHFDHVQDDALLWKQQKQWRPSIIVSYVWDKTKHSLVRHVAFQWHRKIICFRGATKYFKRLIGEDVSLSFP